MTFFRFDDHLLPTDTREVLQASALLEVTEFRLFELAYRRWHGRDAVSEQMERIYAEYMFRDRAPAWVRQYTRAVLDASRSGTLDPAAFGVTPVVPEPSRTRKGIGLSLLVAGVVLTLHVIAELVARY